MSKMDKQKANTPHIDAILSIEKWLRDNTDLNHKLEKSTVKEILEIITDRWESLHALNMSPIRFKILDSQAKIILEALSCIGDFCPMLHNAGFFQYIWELRQSIKASIKNADIK